MDWSIADSRPIWLQLEEQLTKRILSGEYPMGSRMPTVRELAAEAGVNPNTMQRALSALEGSGLVVTQRTAGRVVTEDQQLIHAARKEQAAGLIAAYLQGMQNLGFTEEEVSTYLKEGN